MMIHRHTPVRLAVATILGVAALSVGVPAAMAQDAQANSNNSASNSNSNSAKSEDALQEVQITGTRIRRKDLEANSPILTIGADVLENRTDFAIESALNELPQFVPSLTGFSDVNRQQQLGAA